MKIKLSSVMVDGEDKALKFYTCGNLIQLYQV